MEKILIIDDSRVQVANLKNILGDDYDITAAHTAAQGLECVKNESYSLILLDVIMPDMDGFKLLKLLQEELVTRHIPVILITGLAEIKHEEYGLMLGAVDYIIKPFHPSIIKARVRTHIKLYQYRIQIERQSKHDQLTGIANRRSYDEYSQQKWADAVRLQTPFSICMLDIDKFKVYNDTFGHPAGDEVIASVAKTAASLLQRSTDFIARYGGEEFAAIMLGCGSQEAFSYMKKLRMAVEDLHIEHNPEAAQYVTVSIGGVTLIPAPEDKYENVLKIADNMLYKAKNLGRNRVVWSDENGEKLIESKNAKTTS